MDGVVGTLRAAHTLKAGLGERERGGPDGYLHCDLRPDNLVLVPGGDGGGQPHVYIIDW